jgi:hypothetical protein
MMPEWIFDRGASKNRLIPRQLSLDCALPIAQILNPNTAILG